MPLAQKTIQRLHNQYGRWALVTGATSGIGEALARELAAAGFHLVLTGRREALLQQLCDELSSRFGNKALAVVGDLSKEADIAQLIEATNTLPIGMAVLNAGFGTSGPLLKVNIEEELNLIELNCKTVLRLSQHYAQHMKEGGRKGALVLLSSMVAFQGVPFAANYAASKAYVQSLGEALARELKPEGINVLCAAPGPVNSGFADRANMRMGQALSPEQIAVPIIQAIGKKQTVLPGFLTKLLVYNLRTVPRWAKVRIMEKVMGGFTKHQLGT